MAQKKKQIRSTFRQSCFKRDGYKCAMCGWPKYPLSPEEAEAQLDAHHITDRNLMPNGGYVPENGISLCDECHVKAEVFHKSEGRESIPGYLPEDLYRKIGSTYEKAVKKSAELN